MSRKFREIQGSGESRFGGSEKDCYFLKFPKWQHKLVWNYKREKLVSYFLNNATKTCLYRLKILENIEIEHIFLPKAFFHLSSNLHTSCFSDLRQRFSQIPDVFYLKPETNWIKENAELNETYYYKDQIHLIEEEY